jgi:hypothetical protein
VTGASAGAGAAGGATVPRGEVWRARGATAGAAPVAGVGGAVDCATGTESGDAQSVSHTS